MNKQQIEQHESWKYISDLPTKDRYTVLFGKTAAEIEKFYDCKIEKWAYGRLGDVKPHMLATAVHDTFSGTMCLAVLIPNVLEPA